jgi:hypothetical protein
MEGLARLSLEAKDRVPSAAIFLMAARLLVSSPLVADRLPLALLPTK